MVYSFSMNDKSPFWPVVPPSIVKDAMEELEAIDKRKEQDRIVADEEYKQFVQYKQSLQLPKLLQRIEELSQYNAELEDRLKYFESSIKSLFARVSNVEDYINEDD